MFKRIDHVEIVPRNAEKAIDFYVNILGFSIKNRIEVKIDNEPAHRRYSVHCSRLFADWHSSAISTVGVQ